MKLLSFFLLSFLILPPISHPSAQTNSDAGSAPKLQPGVVIESVAKNSAAEKAGIQMGDILLNWVRANARGPIESPFDLAQAEIEQAPDGNVILEGLRGSEPHSWTIGPDVWGTQARPNFHGKLLDMYQQGGELYAAGKFGEAAERWRSAAEEAQKSQSGWVGPWLLLHAAEMLSNQRQYKEADDAYQRAVQMSGTESQILPQLFQAWAGSLQQRNDWNGAERYYELAVAEARKFGPENLMVALNINNLGLVAYNWGNLAKAEESYQRSLDIRQKLAPGSLEIADSLDNLGIVTWRRGELENAEMYHRKALAIRQKLAPGSLGVANTLGNLGQVAWNSGDLRKAEEYQLQALHMRQTLAPESLDVALSFSNLGLVAADRGDLEKAEEYHGKALAIRQKLAPGSLGVTRSLHNLGNVAWNRGDLEKAEEYHRQSVEILEKLAPGSLDLAVALNGLGVVVGVRGNLAEAEQHLNQALKIGEKLAPGSVAVANSLNNLGDVAWARGDLLKAQEYQRQSLAIMQKLAPGSLDVAVAFNDLGIVAKARGEPAKAEKYHNQALAIAEKLSPDGLVSAISFQGLGDVARERHDLAKAEQYFRRALAIREKLEPGSAEHAESLAALASVLRDRRQLDTAAHLFQQALDALETQTKHLGGSQDLRSEFRARYSDYYKDYIDLLNQQKQPEEAFHVVERWRSRSLLETLAAARVDIHQGADTELLEREHSLQASLNAKRDRRISLLTGKHTTGQVEEVEKEIEVLVSAYEEIENRLRATSPAYAALTQPQALTAQNVQPLLNDDTLLLEYSLGKERSYLWALTSASLTVHELPSRRTIEAVARSLYRQVSAQSSTGATKGQSEQQRQTSLATTASDLSRMILGPVAQQLEGKRLLIVADGALQYIPFAFLPQPGKGGRVPLMVEHEIVYSPSASVLAELRRQASGREPAPKAVAVLADPVFDPEDPRVHASQEAPKRPSGKNPPPVFAQHLSRSASEVGLAHLPRLPFSRREADAIIAAVPAGQGLEALGFAANRATATSQGLAQYRVIHFATHGLSDNQHPELSGLVLSLVDQQGRPQNGFLDLQDIYNLNLPAELVVLSACETALGKEIQGEGLVGLTRGFMYAGATRVVASLWNTDDVSTKELMEKFYRAMEQENMSPAAALRRAQIDIWKQRRWRNPYYWAAFQVQGEWK